MLISAASPIHTSIPSSASNRSNQREQPVASIPMRTLTPLSFGPSSAVERISIFNMDMPQSSLHSGHFQRARQFQTEALEQNRLVLSRAAAIVVPRPDLDTAYHRVLLLTSRTTMR